MKKIYIPFLAFIILCLNVTAQEKSKKELRGDKYTFSYSYNKAIDMYTHTKDLSVDGQRRLAECYKKTERNVEAEEAYLKLTTMPGGNMPEDYYNLAMVLKSNGKYEESAKWMDKFYQLKPEDLRAKDYAANGPNIANLLKDDGKYKIIHQNTNTSADDFAPSFYKNKIVFTSSRSSKMFPKKYSWNRKPFYNMYVSEVENGQMKAPENFVGKFNGKMHDGASSFSNDGNFMAFTRNNYDDKSKDRVVELQIWFSKNEDGKWSKPEPFVLNNKAYSVGQPSLTADGKTMYFTSDMPGGFGGTDLYVVKKAGNGEWGSLKNLGNTINTEGDEMFPFIEEKNGVFAFSSNGRFGLGGLDIFICQINGNEFSRVYNAGFPLNTKYDDFAAIVDDKMSKGYFSSNRSDGSGDDDIYAFDLLKPKPMEAIASVAPEVGFSVYAPKNIPSERRIRETFPLRNYVFFNLGSNEIPNRYVFLKKDQVKEFKEDQLEVFSPKETAARSKRQMLVYYNVINILGDRMGKNPSSSIKLVGSSEKGPEEGIIMATSVKQYLVDIFGIDAKRISIEGRTKPKLPSEQPGGKNELDLLREGDRRVSIESSSPVLLIEFQSGPEAPLKPVQIIDIQQAPVESYVIFDVKDTSKIVTSWSMEITDKNAKVQNYGPFTEESVSIPGKTILGDMKEGDFKVTMIGLTKSGDTIRRDTTVNMVLWTPGETDELMRFSIIYEFNDATSINIYDKYLTQIVTPKISKGATVIIHGYTDIIGEDAYNQKLSLARANDVKKIIEKALAKTGRKDVSFEILGYGEDLKYAPFDNKYPEERFYNRTVIIDIVPAK